jgi:ribonuclease HI/exonuclease III
VGEKLNTLRALLAAAFVCMTAIGTASFTHRQYRLAKYHNKYPTTVHIDTGERRRIVMAGWRAWMAHLSGPEYLQRLLLGHLDGGVMNIWACTSALAAVHLSEALTGRDNCSMLVIEACTVTAIPTMLVTLTYWMYWNEHATCKGRVTLGALQSIHGRALRHPCELYCFPLTQIPAPANAGDGTGASSAHTSDAAEHEQHERAMATDALPPSATCRPISEQRQSVGGERTRDLHLCTAFRMLLTAVVAVQLVRMQSALITHHPPGKWLITQCSQTMTAALAAGPVQVIFLTVVGTACIMDLFLNCYARYLATAFSICPAACLAQHWLLSAISSGTAQVWSSVFTSYMRILYGGENALYRFCSLIIDSIGRAIGNAVCMACGCLLTLTALSSLPSALASSASPTRAAHAALILTAIASCCIHTTIKLTNQLEPEPAGAHAAVELYARALVGGKLPNPWTVDTPWHGHVRIKYHWLTSMEGQMHLNLILWDPMTDTATHMLAKTRAITKSSVVHESEAWTCQVDIKTGQYLTRAVRTDMESLARRYGTAPTPGKVPDQSERVRGPPSQGTHPWLTHSPLPEARGSTQSNADQRVSNGEQQYDMSAWTYEASSLGTPPNIGYFERQDKGMCLVHSINNCLGARVLDGTRILQYCKHMQLREPNLPWESTFHATEGDFCMASVNRYLWDCAAAGATRLQLHPVTHSGQQARLTELLPALLAAGGGPHNHTTTAPCIGNAGAFIVSVAGPSYAHAIACRRQGTNWYVLDSMLPQPVMISDAPQMYARNGLEHAWRHLAGLPGNEALGHSMLWEITTWKGPHAVLECIPDAQPAPSADWAAVQAVTSHNTVAADGNAIAQGTHGSSGQDIDMQAAEHEPRQAQSALGDMQGGTPAAQLNEQAAAIERPNKRQPCASGGRRKKQARQAADIRTFTQRGAHPTQRQAATHAETHANPGHADTRPGAAEPHAQVPAHRTTAMQTDRDTQEPIPASADMRVTMVEPMPMPNRVSVYTHNIMGLRSHGEAAVIEANSMFPGGPDVLVLTETKTLPYGREATRAFRQHCLAGYETLFTSAQPSGCHGKAGVMIAVRTDSITVSSVKKVKDTPQTQGYVAHMQLDTHDGKVLHLVGIYIPPDCAEARRQVYKYMDGLVRSCQVDGHYLIAAGDWNATLAEADRNTSMMYPVDKWHRQEMERLGLKPCAIGTDRHHTYWRYVRDATTDTLERRSTSRIDDIFTLRTAGEPGLVENLTGRAPGGVFDHRAVGARLDANVCGITRRPKLTTEAEREGNDTPQAQRLQLPIPAQAVAAARAAISARLTAPSADFCKVMHELGGAVDQCTQAGATPEQLTTLQGTLRAILSAHDTDINKEAGKLGALLDLAYEEMLRACPVKPPPVKYVRARSNAARKPYAQAYRRTQALKHMLGEAAEAQRVASTHGGAWQVRAAQSLLRYVSSQTALNAHLAKTQLLQALTDLAVRDATEGYATQTQRQQRTPEAAQTGNLATSWEQCMWALTREKDRAIDLLKQQKKLSLELDAKRYRKRFQSLLSKQPKKGHRRVMNADKDESVAPATKVRDPGSGVTYGDAATVKHLLSSYFGNTMGIAPGRTKTGKFLPTEALRSYPWNVGKDRFELTSDAVADRDGRTMLLNMRQESVFWECLHHLKNNKAAGPDGIPNELLKILPEQVHRAIYDMFGAMYVLQVTPDAWKQSRTVLLPKTGDPADPANYRPIGLLNTVYKLWTSTLTVAIAQYAEAYNIFSQCQEGFRQHRNTTRQLQMFLRVLEDAATAGRNLYTLYIDFKCAFNTIDHDLLLHIMYDLGYPADMVGVIGNLYRGAGTRISTPHGPTGTVDLGRGTVQGDSLSPMLFIIFIEPLIRWLHVGGNGYRFGCLDCEDPALNDRYNVSSLAYADDLSVLTNDHRCLQAQADKITAFCQWSGMSVTHRKCIATGIMHGDAQRMAGHVPCTRPDDMRELRRKIGNIKVMGETIPLCSPHEKVEYLGVMMTHTLYWKPQIDSMIDTARTKCDKIVQSLASPDQCLRMIQRCVKPALMYSFHLAALTSTDISVLDSILAGAVRQCYRLPRNTATAALLLSHRRMGFGLISLQADYVQLNTEVLVNCMNDPGRLGTVTNALLRMQRLLVDPGTIKQKEFKGQLKLYTLCKQLGMAQQHDMGVSIGGAEVTLNQSTIGKALMEATKDLNKALFSTEIQPKHIMPLLSLGLDMDLLFDPQHQAVISTRELDVLRPGKVARTHKLCLNRLTHILAGGLPNEAPNSVKERPLQDRMVMRSVLPVLLQPHTGTTQLQYPDTGTLRGLYEQAAIRAQQAGQPGQAGPAAAERPNGKRRPALEQPVPARRRGVPPTATAQEETAVTATQTAAEATVSKDAHLTNTQRQGFWPEQASMPPLSEADQLALLRYVKIQTERTNLDVDLPPSGDYTIQIGLTWPDVRAVKDNGERWLAREHDGRKNRAYVNGPTGAYIGGMSDHRLQYLMTLRSRQVEPQVMAEESKATFPMQVAALLRRHASMLNNQKSKHSQRKYQKQLHGECPASLASVAMWVPPPGILLALHECLSFEYNLLASPLTMPTEWGHDPIKAISPHAEDTYFGHTHGNPLQFKWFGRQLVVAPHHNALQEKMMRWAIASATDPANDKPTIITMLMPHEYGAPYRRHLDNAHALKFDLLYSDKDTYRSWDAWIGHANPDAANSGFRTRQAFDIEIIMVYNQRGRSALLEAMPRLWDRYIQETSTQDERRARGAPQLRTTTAGHAPATPTMLKPKPYKNAGLLPSMAPTNGEQPDDTMSDQPPSAAAIYRCTRATANHPMNAIYTDGSCIAVPNSNVQQIGAGVYDARDNYIEHRVNPAGHGATNTINRAELSAIHCALAAVVTARDRDITICTDSLCSLYQIRKIISEPARMRFSKHMHQLINIRNLLVTRSRAGLITRLVKVPAHAGSVGNEKADTAAVEAAKNPTSCTWTDGSNNQPRRGIYWVSFKPDQQRIAVTNNPHAPPAAQEAPDLTTSVKRWVSDKTDCGFSNVHTEYTNAWRQQYDKLDSEHSSECMRKKHRTTLAARMTAFKAWWGLLWNNAAAKRCGRAVSAACPLCGCLDSSGHILGGCQHRDMKSQYIKRHDEAVKLICKAIMNGSNGGCFITMDAGKQEDLPTDLAGRKIPKRLPEWLLPDCEDRERLRPDILLVEGLTQADVAQGKYPTTPEARARSSLTKIHLLEIGYCSDTRHHEKCSDKQRQHQMLVNELRNRGWSVQYQPSQSISLGVAGSIRSDLIPCMRQLGVSHDDAAHLAERLHFHAVGTAHQIASLRRGLERHTTAQGT